MPHEQTGHGSHGIHKGSRPHAKVVDQAHDEEGLNEVTEYRDG